MAEDPPSSPAPSSDDFEFEELDIGSPDEPRQRHRDTPAPPEVDFSEEETAVVFDDEEDSHLPVDATPVEESPPQTTGESTPASSETAIPAATPKTEIPPRRNTPAGGSVRATLFGAFKRRLPTNPLEWASLAFVGLFFIVGAIAMQNAYSNAFTKSEEIKPDDKPPKTVEGELLTLEITDTYWRDRRQGDPGRPEFKILPALEAKVTSGGQSAFVHALFRDEFGAIQGDAVAFKVEGGTFRQNGSPAATFLGSGGFTNRVFFAEYVEFETIERWTVTIKESADNQTWNQIAHFKLPAKFLREDSQ
ncbi:MAG: hypothetical protein AAGA58_13475 [Verrucomicrobiota bacterium]